MQQGVPGQRPHRQGDQELDQVLVEGFLQIEEGTFVKFPLFILKLYGDSALGNWVEI